MVVVLGQCTPLFILHMRSYHPFFSLQSKPLPKLLNTLLVSQENNWLPTDGPTDGRTDGRTDPLKEMRGINGTGWDSTGSTCAWANLYKMNHSYGGDNLIVVWSNIEKFNITASLLCNKLPCM